MTNILLISAGTGTPSAGKLLGEQLGSATRAELERADRLATLTHLELRHLASDLAHHLTSHVASPALQEAFDQVQAAAGLIVVSPVMNGSYSGLFKMFFDALDEKALHGRPVLLAATGGTARHSLMIDQAMLPMFYYLKAKVSPHPVFAATKDWGNPDGKLARRVQRAAKAFAQILLHSQTPEPLDEFAVVDFTKLLEG